MDIQKLARKNILDLEPYASARDEFNGTAHCFLDANENPLVTPYNRYPDPHQRVLKERIAEIKRLKSENIFLGNGSDEAIDLLIAMFCEPQIDNIVSIAPTYGMYKVVADCRNVEFREALLNEDFSLNVADIENIVDLNTKMVFFCSPNNPSGSLLDRENILDFAKHFSGIVVIDEAYIDFANSESFILELNSYNNIVVLQTFSKAWGMAGVRLGMAFAHKNVISILNKIKYPYNINQLTQEYAIKQLDRVDECKKNIQILNAERESLTLALNSIKFIIKVYRSDSNFLLVKVDDANEIYNYLINKGVIVRNRTNVPLCNNCIRITVGTTDENNMLIELLREKHSNG
ncbi:MAG: histidinol-phosphate transaminase [Bacteroidales bacterium]